LFPFLGVDSDLPLQDIHEEPPPEELREEQFKSRIKGLEEAERS
jgi:hypothetical protein